MKKILLTALVTSVLSGCAFTQGGNPYSAISINVSYPELNSESTVFVGENMVNQGTVTRSKAIRVNSGETTAYSIHSGDGVLTSQSEIHDFYSRGSYRIVDFMGIEHDEYTLAKNKQTGEICVFAAGYIECENIKNETYYKTISSVNNFKQNLIYLGMPEENKIAIGYREFKNDLARAAFSNDIIYNLDMAKTIAYKGVAIEIINATPSELKYKVIKNFK